MRTYVNAYVRKYVHTYVCRNVSIRVYLYYESQPSLPMLPCVCKPLMKTSTFDIQLHSRQLPFSLSQPCPMPSLLLLTFPPRIN